MNKSIGWLGVAALVAAFVFGGSWSADRVVAQDKGGMTFEIYKDAKDEFRWRLKAGNGKIMATASEGYKTKASCTKAVETIKAGAATAKVEEVEK